MLHKTCSIKKSILSTLKSKPMHKTTAKAMNTVNQIFMQ